MAIFSLYEAIVNQVPRAVAYVNALRLKENAEKRRSLDLVIVFVHETQAGKDLASMLTAKGLRFNVRRLAQTSGHVPPPPASTSFQRCIYIHKESEVSLCACCNETPAENRWIQALEKRAVREKWRELEHPTIFPFGKSIGREALESSNVGSDTAQRRALWVVIDSSP